MAVPSFRQRVGLIEIKNKERKMQEEIKKREENKKEYEITEEDQARLNKLKELGILR